MITNVRSVALVGSVSVYVTVDRTVQSAILEWRPAGDTVWRRGFPFSAFGMELRSWFHGDVPGPGEWPPPRLSPDTLYEFQVSVQHTDGTSDQSGILTVRTVPLLPPPPSNFVFVSQDTGNDVTGTGSQANPYKTMAKAMNYDANGLPQSTGNIPPGTAIVLFPSTAPYLDGINTRYKAGTPTSWYHVYSLDPQNPAVIAGGKRWESTGNPISAFRLYPGFGYWAFSYLKFDGGASQQPMEIAVWQTASGMYLHHCTFRRWGGGSSGGCVRIRDSGISYLHNLRWDWQTGDPSGMQNALYLGPGTAGVGQISVLDCYWDLQSPQNPNQMDAVFTYPEDAAGGGWGRDGEMHGCTILSTPDEAPQIEGTSIGVRIWGNRIHNCFRAVGLAQPLEGPCAFYRNIITVDAQFQSRFWQSYESAMVKLGGAGMVGPIYVLNNTFYALSAPNGDATGIADDSGTETWNNFIWLNNLVIAPRRLLYCRNGISGISKLDHNVYSVGKQIGGYFAQWRGTNYPDLASYAQASGQEQNSREVAWSEAESLLPGVQAGDFTPAGAAVGAGTYVSGVTEESNSTPDVGAVRSSAVPVTHTLTITAGIGGTTEPAPGQYQYSHGQTVTVRAIPDAGHRFAGWMGDVISDSDTVTVLMDGPKSIAAAFVAVQTVQISIDGPGTTSPAPGTYQVDQGTTLVLQVSVPSGWRFIGWHVNGVLVSQELTYTLTVDSDVSIQAVLEMILWQVNISVVGQGQVSVPAGQYQDGTVLTLEAQPAGGWIFFTWQGDLQTNQNPITVTVDRDLSIVAVFQEITQPPPSSGGGVALGIALGLLILAMSSKGRRDR